MRTPLAGLLVFAALVCAALMVWNVRATVGLEEALMERQHELSGQSVEMEVTRNDGQSALIRTERYRGETDAAWGQRHLDAVRMFKGGR